MDPKHSHLSYLFILGASDPEMALIEQIITEAGARVVYATDARGARVLPSTAYRAVRTSDDDLVASAASAGRIVCVECQVAGVVPSLRVDHHQAGDPGFGMPPEQYLPASSVGQVLDCLSILVGEEAMLPGWAPLHWRTYEWVQQVLLTAAADHCLGAAYRGECPGIDPEALLKWRIASRATYQGRSHAEIEAEIEAARSAIRSAPRLDVAGADIADMRREVPVPELVEASMLEAAEYVSQSMFRGH